MFYGPAGIGKRRLSITIANTYDLPLPMSNDASLHDSRLHQEIYTLAKCYAIQFEDVDAAGITQERTVLAGTPFQCHDDEDSENSREHERPATPCSALH